MHSLTKQIIVMLCALMIILIPAASSSFADLATENDELTTEKMAVDLVAIRPLGIVSTLFGCTLYVFSLPFSIPGGNADEVWETTVVTPARYTFDRPLGDF